MSGLELGTLGEWAAAVGTIAAFFVTWRLLKHELEERQSAREKDEREQARLVSAWVDHSGITQGPNHPAGGSLRLVAVVLNNGNEPVHDLRVLPAYLDFTPFDVPVREEVVLPPGERKTFEFKLVNDPNKPAPGRYRATVSFTDSAGQRWQRTAGRLEKV